MCTHIFMAAQADPTVMIGGTLPLLEAGHRVGRGETIILESCEYCRIKTINDFFPFFSIVSFRFGRTRQFCSFKILPILPFRIFITTWHILPYNNAHLITISIPTSRFYFYMFPYHIKAKILRFFNIIAQRLICRCRI